MNIEVGKAAIYEAAEKLKNWGRWGAEDRIGTLNHITPELIRDAAKLVRTGDVFAMGIPLNNKGPQSGLFGGRWNPIHTMLRGRRPQHARPGGDPLGFARPHLP